MDSIRRAVRRRAVTRDTFGRLHCGNCGQRLRTLDPDDLPHRIRRCDACDLQWREVG
ncbi:MAG: hypothetical protein RI544_00455 [Haloquadratum sp.]|jgi:hypothetical protein|nr:hypothetical protein [Haloferacaceae archaeon]MDR9444614.1 hypothetical protein [Haloquadratum sp.]